MKTRIITAAVLIPISLCILIIFPPIVLTLVLSAISTTAAYEFLKATKTIKYKRTLIYTMVTATLIPPTIFISTLIPNATLVLLNVFLPISFIFFSLLLIDVLLAQKGEILTKFRLIPLALCAGVLIPFLLSTLINLKTMPYGNLLVMLPVIISILTDSGAYFTGIAIGKRKPFPKISPKKTTEGFIGGIIIGTFATVVYATIIANTTPLNVIIPATALFGLIGSITTEIGDLSFSLIKRKCDIKDYGTLIPGHGGILDRLDGMILCAPTVYLLISLIPAIII